MGDTTALKDIRWEKAADGSFDKFEVKEEAADLKALDAKAKAKQVELDDHRAMKVLLEGLTDKQVGILRMALSGFLRIKKPSEMIQDKIDAHQKELDALNTALEKEKP